MFFKELTFPETAAAAQRFSDSCYQHKHGLLFFKEKSFTRLIVGDAFMKSTAKPWQRKELFDDFYQDKKDKLICGYYLDSELKATQLKSLALGVSHIFDLKNFGYSGKEKELFRRARNKKKRENWQILWVKPEQQSHFQELLRTLFSSWAKKKKLHLGYLLSSFEMNLQKQQMAFALMKDSQCIGFCSFHPYGDRGLALDHIVYDPQVSSMVADVLLTSVLEWAAIRHYSHFSLGLSAFHGLTKGFHKEGFVMSLQKLCFFYNSSGIYQFKSKYSKNLQKRFLVFDPRISASFQLALLSKNTIKANMRLEE